MNWLVNKTGIRYSYSCTLLSHEWRLFMSKGLDIHLSYWTLLLKLSDKLAGVGDGNYEYSCMWVDQSIDSSFPIEGSTVPSYSSTIYSAPPLTGLDSIQLYSCTSVSLPLNIRSWVSRQVLNENRHLSMQLSTSGPFTWRCIDHVYCTRMAHNEALSYKAHVWHDLD